MSIEELMSTRADGLLQEVPAIPWYYTHAFEAQRYLARFRQLGGMGVAGIDFNNCILYCDRRGIRRKYTLWFSEQIIIIDNAFLKVNKENTKDT